MLQRLRSYGTGVLLLLGGLLFAAGHAVSQTSAGGAYEDSLPLTRVTDEMSWGLMLHTQGAGFTFARGLYVDGTHVRMWVADLAYIRNLKEQKTTNPVYDEGASYVYGKVNAFHTLRLLTGRQVLRSEKIRKDAVRFSTMWLWGASLGIEKPVYLEIGYPDIPYTSISVERYNPDEHFSDDIFGQASWVNGINELTLVPGVHLSYSLEFEYGNQREVMRSLNIGVDADVFLKEPMILAEKFDQNSRYFITLHAKLQLGRRWTRK
jgi:hypothetical protein